MNRLTQILQNTFIRVEGLFSVIFGSIFSFFGNIFGTFARVAGLNLNQSSYYLESEPTQNTQQSLEKPSTKPTQNPTVESSSSQRRRPNTTMDYYRKMANEINKK
ncbi:threonine dehydratase [Nostoc sp. TCL26-01]|uniref:threonine dehydratase n=1 Tax=Nostoc sp. TCL26-01 TaxID=2576904 RepID=UPI0015BB5C43|nr:threonine dehydratase [Nostoc sp. TCL26-01]QLE54385.1 threonine dehydratase [Nostoc sp. TCL26-01]